MPKELWEKLLSEIGQKKMARTIFFHVTGEPLLHKDIFDAIQMANDLGLSVSLYTNGALLKPEHSKRLLGALRNGRVVISLQDTSGRNFSRRCRGLVPWDSYIKQIGAFIHMARNQTRQIPVQVHCMIDVTGMGWDLRQIFSKRRELQTVYNWWRSFLGERIGPGINVFDPARSYPLGKSASFFIKHAGNWDNQLLPENVKVLPQKRGHCALMEDTFAVLSDGTCTFCCDDYEGLLNLGNAYKCSMEEIFYGEKSKRIRQAEQNGRFLEKRCQQCRGILIDKRTGKKMISRNLLTDAYVFKHHMLQHGLGSAAKKVLENIQKKRTACK